MRTAVESKLARLTVDVGASVARVVLRNVPLNVIDIPMMEELAQALGEIEARSDVSVLVLSGEGRAFSAGAKGVRAARSLRLKAAPIVCTTVSCMMYRVEISS